MKRTLPSIDEIVRTAQKQANETGEYVDTCRRDNGRHTVPSCFYKNTAERPETVRSESIIEACGGLREALRACKKKILRR